MFSLTCILTKNNVEFLPIEILMENVRANSVFFDHQNYVEKSKWKQRGFFDQRNYIEKSMWKNVDISTIEITSEKVGKNDVDFSISEIKSKKVRGNDVEFLISKIISKKYVEMTWKFVKIWSSTYRRIIDVESTSIRRGVPVGLFLAEHKGTNLGGHFEQIKGDMWKTMDNHVI